MKEFLVAGAVSDEATKATALQDMGLAVQVCVLPLQGPTQCRKGTHLGYSEQQAVTPDE
jgi:hypothetical protein